MTGRGSDGSIDERKQEASTSGAQDEDKGAVCEAGGCCGITSGRGGKLRVALLIVLAVVVVVLLVHGFATAG